MPSSTPSGPLAPAGVWIAAALGLLSVVAIGRGMLRPTDPAAAILVAAALFTAIMAIVLGTAGRHHPHRRFGAANYVTVVRVGLTALVAAAVLLPVERRVAWWILGFTLTAAALDGIDGWLARLTRLQSAFGARFDMEIDALLILVLSVQVWRFGKAGVWIVLAGLLRYLFVGAGLVFAWMRAPLSPTWRAKAVAVAQFIGLAGALAPVVRPPASTAVAAVALSLLTWSFGLDVLRLWRGRGGGGDAAGSSI